MPFGFRVDQEVLEAVVKEPCPSLVHSHPPGAVDALPEQASDRCRLRPVIRAVFVCLERCAELGDGVGILRHLDEGTNHCYEDSAVIEQRGGFSAHMRSIEYTMVASSRHCW